MYSRLRAIDNWACSVDSRIGRTQEMGVASLFNYTLSKTSDHILGRIFEAVRSCETLLVMSSVAEPQLRRSQSVIVRLHACARLECKRLDGGKAYRAGSDR